MPNAGHPTSVKEVKGSTLKIFSDLPSPIAKQLPLHHFVFYIKLLLIIYIIMQNHKTIIN